LELEGAASSRDERGASERRYRIGRIALSFGIDVVYRAPMARPNAPSRNAAADS
jgi:hypothetical protein